MPTIAEQITTATTSRDTLRRQANEITSQTQGDKDQRRELRRIANSENQRIHALQLVQNQQKATGETILPENVTAFVEGRVAAQSLFLKQESGFKDRDTRSQLKEQQRRRKAGTISSQVLTGPTRGQPRQTTPTEEELRMSLPSGIRDLSPAEVRGRQSIAPPIMSVAPPTPKLGTGDFLLTREETQDLRLQSLPVDTVGVAPTEQITKGSPVSTDFIGFNISPKLFFPAQERDITFKEIQSTLRKTPSIKSKGIPTAIPFFARNIDLGLGTRVGAELIPTTPIQAGVTIGLAGASIFAPPLLGTTIAGGVTGLGVVGALDVGLTKEQRIASGLVGGLGAVGFTAGALPFLRNIGARGTRTAPQGFQTVGGIDFETIGLIQPRKGGGLIIEGLPPTSPLVRGGFQVKPGEKIQFLGLDQRLGTSQRSFFEIGKDINIERELFFTPQEPTLGIPETRISRLGLVEPFTFPKDINIGFGFPTKPQIGLTTGTVARTESSGAFAIGKGSELEAIRTTGIIKDIKLIGKTRIKGQGVDIFEFDIGPGLNLGKGIKSIDLVSRRPSTRISGETLLGSLATRPTIRTTDITGALVSSSLSLGLFPKGGFLISSGVIPIRTAGISSRISPGVIPIRTAGISGGGSSQINIASSSDSSLGFFDSSRFNPLQDTKAERKRRRVEERRPPKKKKSKRKGFRSRVDPSFTAQVLDIKGIFPTSIKLGKADLGILPRDIRVIRKRRRKR